MHGADGEHVYRAQGVLSDAEMETLRAAVDADSEAAKTRTDAAAAAARCLFLHP